MANDSATSLKAFRAAFLDFVSDPLYKSELESVRYIRDGLLILYQFLGSGLFSLETAKSVEHPVKVGLGTDVGAGTSFSLLQTAHEAYKVAQLQGQKLSLPSRPYFSPPSGLPEPYP